ncbi:hypothetical protein B0T17DRAFT_262233 [Bombardia bombarda]|uniref:Uncharacterized protein n=1 Tax=Bombardia bombarda TaxID=252184 RepID=A0AA39X0Q7_9PEZI|nr:hypothetical protein B0T17DRAFT_262233 [Bombardia bombarda]
MDVPSPHLESGAAGGTTQLPDLPHEILHEIFSYFCAYCYDAPIGWVPSYRREATYSCVWPVDARWDNEWFHTGRPTFDEHEFALGISTLLALCRTSRVCRAIAEVYLYRFISLSGMPGPFQYCGKRLLSLMNTIVSRPDLASYINWLDILCPLESLVAGLDMSPENIKPISKAMKERFDWGDPWWTFPVDRRVILLRHILISYATKLQHLQYAAPTKTKFNGEIIFPALQTLVFLPWDLETRHIYDVKDVQEVLKAAPLLRSFCCVAGLRDEDLREDFSPNSIPPYPEFANIVNLCLSGTRYLRPRLLTDIIISCGQLKVFSYNSDLSFLPPWNGLPPGPTDIITALGKHKASLRSLNLGFFLSESYKRFMNIAPHTTLDLRSFTRLEYVSIDTATFQTRDILQKLRLLGRGDEKPRGLPDILPLSVRVIRLWLSDIAAAVCNDLVHTKPYVEQLFPCLEEIHLCVSKWDEEARRLGQGQWYIPKDPLISPDLIPMVRRAFEGSNIKITTTEDQREYPMFDWTRPYRVNLLP